MSVYTEDDYLLLSGIQHYAFCRRQWALIHIEQQWKDNLRTTDGALMHERTHEQIAEKRAGLLEVRGLAVCSKLLGVVGACDVVEFHQSDDGVPIHGRSSRWRPIPVEYKKGRPKEDDADALQLCAQAICLEEMLLCQISHAYLYYGETRRREAIDLNVELRSNVQSMFAEMHDLFKKGYTPIVKMTKACLACSLLELCLPKLTKGLSAADYVQKHINEIEV
jgi:CRISPR-associated exonuclease Cas4